MIIDKKLGAACRRLKVSRFNGEELCLFLVADNKG